MSEQSFRRTAQPEQAAASPELAQRRPDAQSRLGNGFLAERLAAQQASPPPDSGSGQEHAPGAGVESGQAAASGAAPLKHTNAMPIVAGEQRRTVLGVQIIGNDVSPSALDACEDFVRLTLGRRRDIQERLAAENVALVIIPRNKKMTDAPQFAALRGTTTFDGRVWDDVRGSGGMRVAGGLWAIGVPEENLVECGPDDYGTGYSVGLHELAHSVHSKGVTAAERARITALFEARKAAGGPWTEAYGASNEEEYFAQCTTCFFGENAGIGQNDPEWLRLNDAPIYAFLVSLYGPPPAQQPAAPANTPAA